MIQALHMGVVAEVALKTALASGLTLGALRLMAGRTAAERSFVAHLGLAATLILPLAALLLPPLAFSDALSWLCEIAAPVWLYAIPAAALGAMTAIAVGRLFKLRNRATVLVEPAWLGALAHAQRRMGFKSGAALLVSPDIASPVSWGLFRPTIVLDERALEAKGEAEAIIAHELAHVARADWAKLLLSRAATALYWFNPLVWLLARQCHELREEAADDAVLRHEVDRSDYAAILVGHARHECRGLLLAANGVAPGRGSLRRRVTRVLDGTLLRTPAGTGFAMIGLLAALTIGTPLAALTLRAPAAPTAPMAPVAPRAVTILPAVQAIPATMPNPPSVHLHELVAPTSPMDAREAAEARAEAAAGAAAVAAIEAHDAVALRKLTVDVLARPEVRLAVADAQSAVRRYTPGELVAMSTQGVTPAWLREMAALGYRNLTIGQVMAMAVQDVDPSYVRGMAAAGYSRLTVEQLVAMRIQDVTPEFARAANAAGGKPSVEWLIARRMGGHSPGVRAAPSRLKAPRATIVPPVPPHPPADGTDDND